MISVRIYGISSLRMSRGIEPSFTQYAVCRAETRLPTRFPDLPLRHSGTNFLLHAKRWSVLSKKRSFAYTYTSYPAVSDAADLVTINFGRVQGNSAVIKRLKTWNSGKTEVYSVLSEGFNDSTSPFDMSSIHSMYQAAPTQILSWSTVEPDRILEELRIKQVSFITDIRS